MTIHNDPLVIVFALLFPFMTVLTLLFLIRLSPYYSRIVSLMRTSKRYVVKLALLWSLSIELVYLILATKVCLELNSCALSYYFPESLLVLLGNMLAVVVAANITSRYVN